MSGDITRLTTISAPPDSNMVKGFNNTSSSVAATGLNIDSKPELYVPGMPDDLVLLCAADYTSSGATILLPNEGYVLSLSPDHQQFPITTGFKPAEINATPFNSKPPKPKL
jgi:hypothetical protein